MAKGINKVIIVGNLGNDPETRFFPDGNAVTMASVATSEVWKDKQTGQPQERTEWHRCVFRDQGNFKLGQIAGEYLKKGSKVYIEGKLNTRKWQDQSGQDRYVTEIIVKEMQMLTPKQDGGQQGGHAPQQGHTAQQGQQAPGGYAPSQGAPAPRSAPPPPSDPNDFFDDDIPFSNYEYRVLV